MPYYPTDNIEMYVQTLIEEHIDSIERDELIKFCNEIILEHRCRPLLKEFASVLLECEINNENLITAILNSCDWNDMYNTIRNYIEDNYEGLLISLL
jgi:hypothetical protein